MPDRNHPDGCARRRAARVLAVAALVTTLVTTAGLRPASAATTVTDEDQLRAAWQDRHESVIILGADLRLGSCAAPTRSSPIAMTVYGQGHTLEQGCAEHAFTSTGSGRVRFEDLRLVGDGAAGTASTMVEVSGPLDLDGVTLEDAPADALSARGAVDAVELTVRGSGGTAIQALGTAGLGCWRCRLLGNGGDGIASTALGATVDLHQSDVSANAGHGVSARGDTWVHESLVADNGGTGVRAAPFTAIVNTTVSGNGAHGVVAYRDDPELGASMTTHQATIAYNTPHNLVTDDSMAVLHTAVVDAFAANCLAVRVQARHSFSDDLSCDLGGTDNQEVFDLDAQLGPLLANGGPTRTHLPRAGSPLVGAVAADDCPRFAIWRPGSDQRLHRRPGAAGTCDIGAVQRDGEDRFPCPSPFVDVDADHPFCRDITWMSENGFSTGWPDGTYRPGLDVSRQALAAFLWRIAGSPETGGGPTFPDVPPGHDFEHAIAWLAAEGITTGYDDGTFRPTAPITRHALAAMLWRLTGSPPPAPVGFPTFTDVGFDHPFHDAIEWLSQVGVTTGYDDDTFRPTARTTRQAMAAFLHRHADVNRPPRA